MLSIVGKQIYLHYGDDSAFRIVYPNKYDELISFDAEDMIPLSVMRRDSDEVLVVRHAEAVSLGEKTVTIFGFTPEDYSILTPDDYVYNLVLETSTGIRHTLVDEAYLSILKSSYQPDIFDTRRAVAYTNKKSHISDISLVCDFDYRLITKDPVEGTLILFDRLAPPAVESEGDDTLILFGAEEKEETDDSTLIIF